MSVATTDRWLNRCLAGVAAYMLGAMLYSMWMGRTDGWIWAGLVMGIVAFMILVAVIAVRSAGARYFKDLS